LSSPSLVLKVGRPRLSLIIADDHPLVRAGIKEVLSADRLYDLIAIAQTGAECLELVQRLKPDVALIDVNISQPGAAQILRALKDNHGQTRICFLTEDQIPPDLREARKDRTAVFVNERFPEDLRDRLREIAAHLNNNKTPATTNSPAAIDGAALTGSKRQLTVRQNEIVTMLKTGSSNREIARVLGVTEGTIKVHLHRIFRRIGVANRTQLAAHSFAAERATAPLKPGKLRKI
jgi:two-component system, NarL family, nitrate/nitrite response regulator NarL